MSNHRFFKMGGTLALVALVAGCAQAPVLEKTTTGCVADLNQSAYVKLNQARIQAGLTPVAANPALADAALMHARYLAVNNQVGHGQMADKLAFSAPTPWDRARQAGFDEGIVAEAIAPYPARHNEPTLARSFDDLFAGIYHRMILLDGAHTDLGAACVHERQAAFVYKLGRPAGTAPVGQDGALVTWPPPQATDIPPAFFREHPDPLPEYDFSGYPVSVAFNPEQFAKPPQQVALALFKEGEQTPLSVATLLGAHNDPHQMLNGYQFALFPEQRLAWGQDYRVELRYFTGKWRTEQWRFSTRALDFPLYVIGDEQQQVLRATNGEPFAIQVTQANPDGSWGVTGVLANGLSVETDFIDPHTVVVTATGRGSGTLTVNGTLVQIML